MEILKKINYLLSETTGVGIGITRRSKYSMYASLSAFLVNFLLNFLLIPNFGAAGAALATVLAFFVFFTFKTEASMSLWRKIPRLKMYMIILSYVVATSIMVLTSASLEYFYLIWVVLFTFTCLLYVSRVFENVIILKNLIIKR